MAEHADARKLENVEPEDTSDRDGGDADSMAADDTATQAANDDACATTTQAGSRGRRRPSALMAAAAVGVAVIVALSGVGIWLAHNLIQTRDAQALRNEFVQAAEQGALNLTTIDHAEVDRDIQRVLDSSTGSFRDEFQQRSQPFVDVVRQAKSKSEGTIVSAGLESQDGDQAQVLVAVSVKTSNAGAPEQEPRAWRMRISVAKADDALKVSDVRFVP